MTVWPGNEFGLSEILASDQLVEIEQIVERLDRCDRDADLEPRCKEFLLCLSQKEPVEEFGQLLQIDHELPAPKDSIVIGFPVFTIEPGFFDDATLEDPRSQFAEKGAEPECYDMAVLAGVHHR